MKQLIGILLAAALCLSLTACGGGNSSGGGDTPAGEATSAGDSEPASQEMEENSGEEEELLPLQVPEEAAGIIREMQVLGTEGVSIQDDRIGGSGGSLTASADENFLELMYDILRKERRQTARPGYAEDYEEFITVRAAESGSWQVQLVRMADADEEACYASLTDVYGAGPLWYRLEESEFEGLYSAMESRITMIDAPVDEFLQPVQIVVAEYRSNTYSADEYEKIYEKPPKGAIIPAVNSVEDFTVAPGEGATAYRVLFPIQGVRCNMVMSMIQVYPPGGGGTPSWRVMTVSFEPY